MAWAWGGMFLIALILWLEVRRRQLKDYTREDSSKRLRLHTRVVKALISILAAIVTHILLFTFLSGRTTCAVTLGAEDIDPQVGRCVMRIWNGFKITYPGAFFAGTQVQVPHPGGAPVMDTWNQFLSPPFLIPAVAGFFVGLILWAAWARSGR